MKNIKNTSNRSSFLKIASITLLFLFVSINANAQSKTVTIKTSAICDMCKNRIELVTNNLDGVKKSMLNSQNKTIKIKYDTKVVSVENIREAISEAGYDADDVAANPSAYNVLPACCKKGSSCDVSH